MESDQVVVHETELTSCWNTRRFLLDDQLYGPDGLLDEGERVRKIVRWCAQDELIRKMFRDSSALLLEVTSSRKYTTFETEHAGLASLLCTYFLATSKPAFCEHRRAQGRHFITIPRLAEFNYRLERRTVTPSVDQRA